MVGRSVKFLSNLNMAVALALLLFVIIAGPTLLIFTSIGDNFLAYIKDTPALTNWIGREDQLWFHDWTIFLLGLVDILVTVCWHVHRAHFPGKDRP